MKTSIDCIEPYQTLDGSEIRELLHPQHCDAVRQQSLAEARVPPGSCTELHRHHVTEEIYHILAGLGRMQLGDQYLELSPGDSVVIPPGTPHCIENNGAEELRFLCCCAPAYSHEDTELLSGRT